MQEAAGFTPAFFSLSLSWPWSHRALWLVVLDPMTDPLLGLQQGFSTGHLVLGQITVCGGHPVHCGMFSSLPGLHPEDANSTPLPYPEL